MKHLNLAPFCLFFSCICLLSSCKESPGKNYLFDFGTSNSPLEEGYIRVSSEGNYVRETGFGWTSDPKRKAFILENIKPASKLLQDGVSSWDSLVFQIDANPGDYVLTINIGMGEDEPLDLNIAVNDKVLAESIQTPWLRLNHQSFSQVVHLTDAPTVVSLSTHSGRWVSVHSLALRPLTEWEDFKSTTLLDQDTAELYRMKKELTQKLESDPDNLQVINQLNDVNKFLFAAYYYDIGWWSWAVEETGMRIFPRYHYASDLLRQIIANDEHPLYDKSVYLIARIHYWLYKEQGNEYNREEYEKYFKLLHDKYPEHAILSMYAGEKILHKSSCQTTDDYAPVWANLQREAICRMQGMIHWWADSVQAENGELGGKFGDDVEILRWWLPVILGADDEKARAAYTRLVDGVWHSGLLERAFSKKVEDVEHSAELFRDTHPAMFLMNYGNPIYVERCLVSMQNFRDTWTGVNDFGHRHFKSCYLSASEVNENPPYAVDVPLNARATLPMLWAAWYNQNPTTIDLFRQWGDAWVEDASRNDNGKPEGLLPAAVAYKDDKIGGYAPQWHNPGEGLGWDYFDWESLGHIAEMYNQLLGLYAITGQKSLLNPMNATFDFMMEHRNTKSISDTDPGSEDWAAAQLWGNTGQDISPNGGIMKLFGSARALVGTDQYDDLILEAGTHYSQYRVTGDENYIEQGLAEILNTIRYNYPLYTTELKFTDRVDIPHDDLLFGMYTGHIGSGFEFPGLAVTWKNTGTDVAVLVGESSRQELDAQLYNFGGNKEIGIYTWQLEPGEYELTLRGKEDGNFISKKFFEINERTSYTTFEIVSKELISLKIRQVKPFSGLTFPRADLAITVEDVSISADWDGKGKIPLEVTVHNIGNKASSSITIKVQNKDRKGQLEMAQIQSIEAPNDLTPRMKKVKLSVPVDWKDKQIVVSINSSEPEITLLNNEISKELRN